IASSIHSMPGLSSTLTTASFSVGGDLIAVSAKECATPPPTMGLRLVAEPKPAGLVLTAFHEVKVSCCQQNGCGFYNRCENSLGGLVLHYSLDGKRARLLPHE